MAPSRVPPSSETALVMHEKPIAEALQRMMGGPPASSGSPLARLFASWLATSQGGGLAGLVEQSTCSGLRPQIQSWISTGQNMRVPPDQLARVFGPGRMQQMAEQAGMDLQQPRHPLAEMLTQVVDRITLRGRFPGDDIENALGTFGRLMDR